MVRFCVCVCVHLFCLFYAFARSFPARNKESTKSLSVVVMKLTVLYMYNINKYTSISKLSMWVPRKNYHYVSLDVDFLNEPALHLSEIRYQ